MSFKHSKASVLCLLAFVITSCSFAPLTPRVDAASIGTGEFKLENNAGPAYSFGVIYGAAENLDVGLDFEQLGLSTAWARYSFINDPTGFSLAGTAGGFYGASSELKSNGGYAGLIVSNQISPTARWTAGYRYAVLDYQYDLGESYTDFDYLDFNNPDDGSVNGQIDISLSFLIKPHVELALGGVCQTWYKNTNPDIDDTKCWPVIGFSFYRL